MATRKQFLAELARHKGATLDETCADYDFNVDAPDGFVWVSTGCAVITVPHNNTAGQSWKSDAYAELIETMQPGLKKVTT